MKDITKQEIIDFIMSQPDDRPVNMYDCGSHHSCGCVMVHYGKEILGIKESFKCSFTDIICDEDFYRMNRGINAIVTGDWKAIKTYGDIKNEIRKQG